MSHNKNMLPTVEATFDNSRSHNPTYQDIDSLELKEDATPGDSALNVVMYSFRPERTFKDALHDALKRTYWWFDERWREKGVPHEQVDVLTETGQLSLYNYGEKLSDAHLEDLQKAAVVFSQMQIGDKSVLDKVKYVLIDNNQYDNPTTGEPRNGGYGSDVRAITLFPNSLADVPHRIDTVSNFLGTLIHEGSHPLAFEIKEEWRDKFGWRTLPVAKPLPGGSYTSEETDSPERCVNDYAKSMVSEDIPESNLAAVVAPERLDSEKLALLRERFKTGTLPKAVSNVQLTRREGNQVELPRITGPVHYRLINM